MARVLLAVLFCTLTTGLVAAQDTRKLTSLGLDAIVAREGFTAGPAIDDEVFLRRISLDLIGRQPTVDELAAFSSDNASDKRARAIDRLLDSAEFGANWANYWSDTISAKIPLPELTFLTYTSFKSWLADKLNKNTGWDAITRELLSASGDIKTNPAVMYVGYHEGRAAKLAAETARIFLGLQLQCAECHDHKFDDWKREHFHGLAAFFGRASGSLGKAQDGSSTIVKDKEKGEYMMPNVLDPRKKGETMAPAFLSGETLALDTPDQKRRDRLAELITQPENPWFARAYVNRLWARLMGRGFYEPVDNMAPYVDQVLPTVHDALAKHFAASKFDIKDSFRLILNTNAYQRSVSIGREMAQRAGNKEAHTKLSGDEVFQSLVTAIGLPNVRPPAMKPTAAIRFPPPPKSTRDLVAEKFGYDPSLCPEEVSRTMAQAMMLMNNDQIGGQIDADPKSGTLLSKLLLAEKDDDKLARRLIRQVLARTATDREVQIALTHVQTVGDRGDAFEDILWSLINSAEFTTRK